MRLKSKICLITGAGNGIGRGIALRFAAEGCAAGIMDVDVASGKQVVDEILQSDGKAVVLPGDVTNREQVHQAVEILTNTFGPPNVLVHNAAVMPSARIDETSEKDWDLTFNVAVKGAFHTSQEVIPLMREAGGGSIIFMASITGVNGLPGLAAYSAAKGALISLARAMAIDHAREGIRVNTISPGTIDSPMLHRFVASQRDPEATQRAFNEIYPRGSVGTIDEVASVFVFLASDEASFVSGANYMVDGGMSIMSQQPRL
jgi:NAD(P)-dependent dehydrogenase (short-subunit alcohol dehydrogenase family)